MLLRIVAIDGGLFALNPRLPDLELLREDADSYVGVGSSIRARFTRDESARPVSLTIDLPNGPITARRR